MSHKMICKLPQLALHCIAILILMNPFAARLNIMMSKLEPISSINPFLMLGYPSHKTLAIMCYMSSRYPLAIFTLYMHEAANHYLSFSLLWYILSPGYQ